MSLPGTDEPLILADGTRISPKNGKVIKDSTARGGFVEIPNASAAQAIVAKTRRAIAELPAPPQSMNAISLVLFYSMWGLSDQDIAITVGALSTDQVKIIKQLPEYVTLSGDILRNVLDYEANDIRTFFQQNAKSAAKKVIDISQQEDGALGFKASQDILDRAGYRPADVVEHKHKFEDALRIEYIKKEVPPDVPVIEATYTEKK